MPKFSRLELKNFKSYRNEVCIDWMQFSSIIGINGTGKSSIVDAIEFVFCFPRFNKISPQNIKEFICNRGTDDNECSSTWVRVTFNINGKEIIFQRSAHYTESVYKYSIDNAVVNIKEYKKRLLECNVNTKANNFLVQQNSIENIAIKGAKERCEFFERICNSIIYKEEYIRLSKKLQQYNLESEQLKKDLNFQLKLKRELLKTSKEVQKYDKLQSELAKIEFDYYFSKLFQIDNTFAELHGEQTELKEKINVVQKIKKSKVNLIAKLKKKLIDQEDNFQKLNNESENAQNKLSKYSSKMSELVQKILHCQNNINNVEKNLIKAKNINTAHIENIKNLKRQYRDVEECRENYEKSQTQSCSLDLKDEQYEEYLKLKAKAQEKFAKQISLFDSIERERDSIKTNIDEINYENRIKLLSEKIKQEKSQIDTINLEINAIKEKIKDKETVENETQEIINQIEKEIEDLIKEKEHLNIDIENLEKEICISNMSKEEERKFKRKQDVLSKLKYNFPGVYDRLKILCNVSEKRYEIPIMKIIGKKMDNIVVNNRFTANKCIEFLKRTYAGDKFSTFETFLPLDYISNKSSDDITLRKIKDEQNVKIASSVIITDSEEMKKLLNHYCNTEHIIICETDDAASNLSFRKNLNCVSLNGTYYKRDGYFSGGLFDLLQQLKKWNYKEYEDLKEKKQKKYTSLQGVLKQINEKQKQKKELSIELESIQQLIERHLDPLNKKQMKELKTKQERLLELEKELSALKTDPRLKQLHKQLDTKNNELEQMIKQKNTIEDEIFEKFCENFHINNIRQYEKGDFKKYKERISRKKEYEIHLDKISNEIEFEESRDTKSVLINLETHLNELKNFYADLKISEDKLKNSINENRLTYSKDIELKTIRQKIEEIKKEIKFEEFQYKLIKKDITEWNSSITSVSVKISNLKTEKLKILMNCKINNIKIPLCIGTIDTIVLKPTADVTMTESTESGSQQSSDSHHNEKELEIDYSSLSDSIKNFEKDDLNGYIILLKDKQNPIHEELQELHPKFKTIENLKLIEQKLKTLNNDYNQKLEKLGFIKQKFNEIKTQRANRFNEFFHSVEEQIDGIFKNLYKSPSAQAYITVKNVEEPYLDGIEFSCIIPKKKFVPMENLSGGEKTMSAIALLLAIYKVKPAPFLIFDEIDAALDNVNINRIANQLLELKSSAQIINISHHELLSSYADVLVGVNISPFTNSSYVVHVELGQYQKKTLKHKCLKNNFAEKPILLYDKLEKSLNID